MWMACAAQLSWRAELRMLYTQWTVGYRQRQGLTCVCSSFIRRMGTEQLLQFFILFLSRLLAEIGRSYFSLERYFIPEQRTSIVKGNVKTSITEF